MGGGKDWLSPQTGCRMHLRGECPLSNADSKNWLFKCVCEGGGLGCPPVIHVILHLDVWGGVLVSRSLSHSVGFLRWRAIRLTLQSVHQGQDDDCGNDDDDNIDTVPSSALVSWQTQQHPKSWAGVHPVSGISSEFTLQLVSSLSLLLSFLELMLVLLAGLMFASVSAFLCGFIVTSDLSNS